RPSHAATQLAKNPPRPAPHPCDHKASRRHLVTYRKDIAMTEASPVRRVNRRARVALAVGLLVGVAIAAALSILPVVSPRPSQPHTVSSSSQVVLPSTRLDQPWGVAVDGAGNLYITDHNTHQLLKLAAGASAPTPLPSAGLTHPTGVAVDSAGNVYVT